MGRWVGQKSPPLGIEPRTCRLTADRSANGALRAGRPGLWGPGGGFLGREAGGGNGQLRTGWSTANRPAEIVFQRCARGTTPWRNWQRVGFQIRRLRVRSPLGSSFGGLGIFIWGKSRGDFCPGEIAPGALRVALVAQLVEHGSNKPRVTGSSPVWSIFFAFWGACRAVLKFFSWRVGGFWLVFAGENIILEPALCSRQ